MSPEQFRVFSESFPEPLILVSVDGAILSANLLAVDLLGLEDEHANLLELAEEERQNVRQYLSLCARTRQMIPGRMAVRNSHGNSVRLRVMGCRPVSTSPNLLLRLDQKEMASRFLLLNEKVDQLSMEVRRRIRLGSDLRQAHTKLAEYAQNLEQKVEERTTELRRNNESLEAFCYSIAHDLRAPLRAITAFSDVLEDELGPKLAGDALGYLKKIRQAGQRMHRLIDDLLAYARLSQGELHITPLELSEDVRSTLKELEAEIRDRAATVSVKYPLPTVRANQTAIQQVLRNILINALKFARASVPPVIEISAQSLQDHVLIYIRDNGIGIAPEHTDRIFKIFERLDPSYPGTGIGLAIVKSAVERMGGAVGMMRNLDAGTTFWVKLPAGETAVLQHAVENKLPQPGQAGGMERGGAELAHN